MTSASLRHFTAFARNTRGGAAMIFALSFIPALMTAGLAIDYVRATNYSAALKAATDAAALAGAGVVEDPRNPFSTDLTRARTTAARNAFNAHIRSEDEFSNLKINVTETANGVAVNTSGTIKNSFGALFRKNTTDLGAVAEAALAANTNYEVVFVLDNTGSMASSNKMTVLKTAMNKFIKRLSAGSGGSNSVRVGLVPFGTFVRVDPMYARGKDWMRQPSRDLAFWQGCITDRVAPYDVDGTTPTILTPDTLFDASDGNMNIFPITPSGSPVGLLPFVPAPCNQAYVQPLTTSFGTFQQAVNAMVPSGTTNLTIGLAWGLHLFSPGAPYGNATPFNNGIQKIMVFLTDGLNTKTRWSSDAATMDVRTQAACDAIKSKGITLYTIGVIDENKTLLTNCASAPSKHFFAPTADRIPDLFEMISGDLVTVRLVR
jgi:Mg-chelatase subunit ChlD